MLFMMCDIDLGREQKEAIRKEVKERTGEDCLILGHNFVNVCSIPVKKDRATKTRFFHRKKI